MSFTITFSINNSENYRLYKDLTAITTLTGVLKAATSILTPTILIENIPSDTISTITTSNYAYIEAFNGRKYFITDIRLMKNNLIEIDMRCDVLSTYADEILQQKAIIKRQENKWNLYLNDGSLQVYQNQIILTEPFPSGFTAQEYVLSVAGS